VGHVKKSIKLCRGDRCLEVTALIDTGAPPQFYLKI